MCTCTVCAYLHVYTCKQWPRNLMKSWWQKFSNKKGTSSVIITHAWNAVQLYTVRVLMRSQHWHTLLVWVSDITIKQTTHTLILVSQWCPLPDQSSKYYSMKHVNTGSGVLCSIWKFGSSMVLEKKTKNSAIKWSINLWSNQIKNSLCNQAYTVLLRSIYGACNICITVTLGRKQ